MTEILQDLPTKYQLIGAADSGEINDLLAGKGEIDVQSDCSAISPMED